jgi:hypothetical protein
MCGVFQLSEWNDGKRFCIAGLCVLVMAIAVCGPAGAATAGRVAVTTTLPFQVEQTLALATQAPACPASWECLPESDAQTKWGTNGYSRYSETPCGRAPTVVAVIPYYCYQKKQVPIRRDFPLVTTTLAVVQKPVCNSGLTLCAGKGCINLSSDNSNCGACSKGCPIGKTCSDGQCIVPVKDLVTMDPCALGGNVSCGGTCINIHGSDSKNCGGCGWECPSGLTCYQGECSMECPAGQIDCQYNCYDPQTDPDHCGSCGNSCTQGQTCCGGKCTSTATDSSNCGTCGKKCPNAQACSNGLCGCKPGYLLCDQQQGCINVDYDWQHCGSCNNICKNPENCIMGHCEFEPSCGTKNYNTNTWETCADGIQNQGETGVDCGGKCAPCNTKCTTGTKYAPADTPCTSVGQYNSALPYVPSSNYPADPHWVDVKYPECPLCYYPCQSTEVCHPALDPIIAEAEKCCSLTSMSDIDSLMPNPDTCKYAIKMAPWSCQKCTGIYIIKELSEGTRWMHQHIMGNSVWDPTHCWDLNNDGKINNDTECQYGEVNSPPWNKIVADGQTPPNGTANYLLNYYHTGICHDYALALTTLLRKDGYAQDDVGSYCDGGHCYNVVRFPGDTKWHLVDTDLTQDGGAAWQYGKLQTGYPYCHTLDENSIFYNMTDYYGSTSLSYTGAIPDINAYWTTVNNGQTYSYQKKTPFLPQCKNAGSPLPCSITYGGPPFNGPGVAGIGKDNWHLPDKGVPVKQIVGC